MQHVTSADGTRIAVDRSGAGPALVIVAGAFSDRHAKKSLGAGLATRFEVFEYDRRGRGDSVECSAWTMEREVDDLAAVIAAAGGTAFVFGDSSGGALALEAAAASLPIVACAVYEVPYQPGPSSVFADQLDELIAAGRDDEAAERFLALFTPGPALAGLKSSPSWAHLTGYAPSLPREVRLCNDGAVPRERFAAIAGPVLALAGGASPAPVHAAARAVAAAVPVGRYEVLDRQGHAVADDALCPRLIHFFTS